MRRMLLCLRPAGDRRAGPGRRHRHNPDITLPERVVTATRVPTLAEQIPPGSPSSTVRPSRPRLHDARRRAGNGAGLHVVQSGGPGGNASVFIRGTNFNQVLVLRDGVPVNDPSDPNGAYQFRRRYPGRRRSHRDRARTDVQPVGLRGDRRGDQHDLATGQWRAARHRYGRRRAAAGGPVPAPRLSGAEGMFDYSAGVQSSRPTSARTPRRSARASIPARATATTRRSPPSTSASRPIDGTRIYAVAALPRLGVRHRRAGHAGLRRHRLHGPRHQPISAASG